MVHLLASSPVPLNSPTLKTWDQSVRENFALYQREIDRTTYALQRSQRGFLVFGSTFYPTLTQHYNQNLDIYLLKQQLGKIEQSEVDQFKVINPHIANHINKTFNTNWYLPNLQDAVIIGGLQAYAQVFNFQYSWRLGFLLLPYCFRVFYEFSTNASRTPTTEFMTWALQYRKAKSQIERNVASLDSHIVETYNKYYGQTKHGLLDTYNGLIELAQQQQPNL